MIGQSVAHYQITEKIGEGGMGEVYRATDTRLKRDVALKVLPAGFAQDPQRMGRFRREAEVLASLNHPNIAAIYGLEQGGSTHAIAMELVEGEPLASRISRGAIPLEEALKISLQIAEALEAAHEKGIIHRDLKPGNIMLTTDQQVKVLDFGLAKAMAPPETSGKISDSTTMTAHATQMGMILGTAAYMSPEQATGKTVDKRSDIWSFGVVVFEMLTGQRLFAGDSVTEALSGVLREEIPWTRLPRSAPENLIRLLKRCLVREPRDRLRDIGEVRLALREDGLGSELAKPNAFAGRSLSRWTLVAAFVAGALATVAIYTALVNRAPALQSPVRTTIEIPEPLTLDRVDRAIALSPDGTQLALVLENPATTQQQLFLRSLDQLELRPLENTEGASYPFWSPDGRSLGFFADSKLKRLDYPGGIVRTLADAPAGRGAAWSPLGFIVFQAEAGGALSQVPADGGAVTPFTTMLSEGEDHRLPHFLPDGRRILFESRNRDHPGEVAVYAFDPDRGEATKILDTSAEAFFVEPGSLVFALDDNLMYQPFDPEQLTLSGAARAIAAGVQQDRARRFLSVDLASNGRLVYQEIPKLPDFHLYWLDRDGAESPAQAESIPLEIEAGRVSPDGQRVALSTRDGQAFSRVHTLDFGRGTLTPVGDPRAFAFGAAWSPDGSLIASSVLLDGHHQLSVFRAQAGGEIRRLTSDTETEYPVGDFTSDGRTILFGRYPPDKLGDLVLINTEGKEPERIYIGGPGDENYPRLSPDGRFVAYLSDASGGLEVWVADYPAAQSRTQVSTRFKDSESGRSGETLRFSGFGWMGDEEIYWQDLGGRVGAATIRASGSNLEVGPYRSLFGGRSLTDHEALLDFSLARERFLLVRSVGTAPPTRLVFVSDWRAALGGEPAP